jgi:hypothetical protein
MKVYARTIRILLCVVICGMFLTQSALAWKPDYIPPPEQLKKMEKQNDQRRAERNTTALMFGKVVDFSGEPVDGAEVTMRLSAVPKSVLYNDQKLVRTVTGKDGSFQFENIGFMYYLVNIKCDGYQFKMDYNKSRSLEFKTRVKANGTGYVSEKPMIFKMRKKAPPAFVLIGNWSFALRDGEAKLLDLYRRDWTSPEFLSGKKFNYHDWETDVKVSADKNGENFQMILEAVKEDSGFVVETPEFIEEMTEAPERGYRPKILIPITKNSGGRLFAYVKSEGGLFYSKIYINYANRADRDHVELDWGYFTNVVGERGLEFVPELAQQYRDDARAGHRPRLKREQLRAGSVVTPVLGAE